MNKNDKNNKIIRNRLLDYSISFISLFLLVCIVTTTAITLFCSGMELSVEHIVKNAKRTLANVFFITALFILCDIIRRRITLDKANSNIKFALQQIMRGDFSVRIEKKYKYYVWYDYDEIIDGINTMAQELSSVETLRNDFIANVSHELKTPLAVIQNYGTLLQSPNLSEEKRIEYSKAITMASRRLAEMISNILKLNKLENQQIFTNSQSYDLSEQICECLLNYESLWEKKNISLESDIEDSVIINADPEMMSIVWNNLFSNAMKFTSENGTVYVSLKKEDANAVVTVKDTGCGMTEEVKSHIFEKFYQGDSSRASEGNGLGLALVGKIIDITKSEISVSSEPGEGSVFTVTVRSE
ncbi:MAG: sensor histidine kinase [Acutalibacteraceae bacterium]